MNKMLHIADLRGNFTKPKQIDWQADTTELDMIRDRLGVLEVKSFTAQISIRKKDLFIVKGKVSAVVIQSCVISGEPVSEEISADFEEFFTEDISYASAVDLDMDSPEINVIKDSKIDVGELAYQYLILSMNPYPRKKGVVFQDKIEDEKKENPFAILEKLKH